MSDKGDFYVVRRSSTSLSNKVIHDKGLSFSALGLLMVCLSLPPNAPAGYRSFLGRGLGEKAVRKALHELEEKCFRFRFQTHRSGQLRTLTIVSDVPLSRAEARAEAEEMMRAGALTRARIGDCVSHPEPKLSIEEQALEPVDNDRAADGAARCDQQEYEAENLTVPRSSAARSRTAQPTYVGSNDSSLRSESHTNQPDRVTRSRGEGVVGGSEIPEVERVAPPVRRLSESEQALVNRVLPSPMRQVLDGSSAPRIAGALEACLELGWREREIYNRLNSNPLPARFAPGLVIHRVEAIRATNPPKRKRPVPELVPSGGADSQTAQGQESMKEKPPPEFFEEQRRKFLSKTGTRN